MAMRETKRLVAGRPGGSPVVRVWPANAVGGRSIPIEWESQNAGRFAASAPAYLAGRAVVVQGRRVLVGPPGKTLAEVFSDD